MDDPLAIGQQVPWPTQAWTVVTPEEMDMDPAILEGAFDYAFAEGKNTQALIVIPRRSNRCRALRRGKGRVELRRELVRGEELREHAGGHRPR